VSLPRAPLDGPTGPVAFPRRRPRASVGNVSVQRAPAGRAHRAEESVAEGADPTEAGWRLAVRNLRGPNWRPPP
jgi:hypothetical protein